MNSAGLNESHCRNCASRQPCRDHCNHLRRTCQPSEYISEGNTFEVELRTCQSNSNINLSSHLGHPPHQSTTIHQKNPKSQGCAVLAVQHAAWYHKKQKVGHQNKEKWYFASTLRRCERTKATKGQPSRRTYTSSSTSASSSVPRAPPP